MSFGLFFQIKFCFFKKKIQPKKELKTAIQIKYIKQKILMAKEKRSELCILTLTIKTENAKTEIRSCTNSRKGSIQAEFFLGKLS